MCTVHRKVFGNQKFLYVIYFCTLHECPIFYIGRRLGKNVFFETTTKVANYNSKLDNLMQEFRDRALLNVHDSVDQIREDLNLGSLVCAGRVGLNKAKKCLDGTRTEILNEVIDWINDTDAAMPRIFCFTDRRARANLPSHTRLLYRRRIFACWGRASVSVALGNMKDFI